jgi:hypothetical protein
MVNNRIREIHGFISARQKTGEGASFFSDVNRGTPAQSLVEHIPAGAGGFPQRHISAHPEPAKGRNLEPMLIPVAKHPRLLIVEDTCSGLRSDDPTRRGGNLFVSKWVPQNPQPFGIGLTIIVNVRHDLGGAFGEAAISGAAQALQWFHCVARTVLPGNQLRIDVARRIVDDKYLVGSGIQA